VVPGRTRLNSDQARRQRLKEYNDIVAAQLSADHYRAHRIYAMHLKDVLGDIQSDCANHAPWTALPHVTFDSHTLAHCDAGSGGRPPHQVTAITRLGDHALSRFSYPDTPLSAPCDRDGFLRGVRRAQMLLGRRQSAQRHPSAWREAEFLLPQHSTWVSHQT
jgi:hypothetical protein